MTLRMKMGVSFFSLLVTATVYADDASFNRLSCDATISSKLLITSPGENLNLQFEARGNELRPLVRALLPNSVPNSLVRAYHCIELKMTIPQSACTFSESAVNEFQCHHSDAPVNFSVEAKLSCYDREADHFAGTADGVTLSSELSHDDGNGFFRVNGSLRLAGAEDTIPFSSEKYIARYWTYDGYPQDPECAVDGLPVIY